MIVRVFLDLLQTSGCTLYKICYWLVKCLSRYQHSNYASIVAGNFSCPKIDWTRLPSPCDQIHRLILDCVTNEGSVQVANFLHYY